MILTKIKEDLIYCCRRSRGARALVRLTTARLYFFERPLSAPLAAVAAAAADADADAAAADAAAAADTMSCRKHGGRQLTNGDVRVVVGY